MQIHDAHNVLRPVRAGISPGNCGDFGGAVRNEPAEGVVKHDFLVGFQDLDRARPTSCAVKMVVDGENNRPRSKSLRAGPANSNRPWPDPHSTMPIIVVEPMHDAAWAKRVHSSARVIARPQSSPGASARGDGGRPARIGESRNLQRRSQAGCRPRAEASQDCS